MRTGTFLIISLSLVACAHQPTTVNLETDLLPELNTQDLPTLDRSQFLIQVDGSGPAPEFHPKSLALVVTNFAGQAKSLSVHDLNLKFWAKNALHAKFYVEKLSDQSAYLGLLSYRSQPVANTAFWQRTLVFKIFDYQKFKTSGKVDLLFTETINSFGPQAEVPPLLPILSAFLGSSLNQPHRQKYLVTRQDPLLARTKSVPTSIDVQDFNLTAYEAEFINRQKEVHND